MKFAVKDGLTEEEIQSGLRNVIRDGLATQAMVTLTGGVFLVAFALRLGASNVIIGLLAAIPPLAQLLQIPAIYLVEKYRVRRAITVYAASSARIFWLLIALIPLIATTSAGLPILLVALFLHSALASIGGGSWNSWMRDLVPQERLGSFFSKRMRLAIGLGIPLSIAAGSFVDIWQRQFSNYQLYSYSILFFLGFVAGMIGIRFISTIPEPRMATIVEKPRFFRLLAKPFKDENFKNLILFLGSWNFAINLAAPFFTVYMLRRLELSMTYVIALMVLSQIMNVLFIRAWGRFADHLSNKSVLAVSGPLFMICILAWSFTTLPEKYFLTVPLLIAIHIFMGISMAGVTLASGNIGLKLAPKGQATAYLAANSVINSLAAGIAPILGGQFADFFSKQELSLTLRWTSPTRELALQPLNLQQWDFFFILAFLIGLYSIHRLAMVKEVGEVEEKVVVQELIAEARRLTRSLSPVGGLRQLTQFPFAAIRKISGK
ncbi:MAG: MFS transporter [candidate division Zixibacteria bacterium SM23_81]|nr:MAG: MFS transporter [candidate division Zixibacteria bacterium SM23_81]